MHAASCGCVLPRGCGRAHIPGLASTPASPSESTNSYYTFPNISSDTLHTHIEMSTSTTTIPLFTLGDIGTTRSWDYSEATLVSPGRYTARTPMTTEAFRKTFFTLFPALSSMNWANVAVRGGAVVDILLGRTPADVDLFIYGLDSPEAFIARANEVIDFLLKTERSRVQAANEASEEARVKFKKDHGYDGMTYTPAEIDVKGVRRGPVVSIFTRSVSVPVQIVLTSYGSLEDVANGADMAVCGASFNGTDVFVTAAGKYGLENLTIVVPDGQFPLAYRLEKYFDKGFDIVLPGLDVSKMPARLLRLGLVEAIETPCMTVSYSSISKNKISLSAFLNVHKEIKELRDVNVAGGPGGERTGYEDSSAPRASSYMQGVDTRSVLFKNIEKLAEASVATDGGEPSIDFSVYAEGDFISQVMSPWPGLTPRQVENTYGSVFASVWSGGNLDFNTFTTFVKTTTMKKVLLDVANSDEALSAAAATAESVRVAIEGQKAACNAALPALEAHFHGKLAPLLSPEQTFKHKMIVSRDVFYGDFLKA